MTPENPTQSLGKTETDARETYEAPTVTVRALDEVVRGNIGSTGDIAGLTGGGFG
jgi:hypothetical protein